MGRPFASCPCEISGDILLFLTSDFGLLYLSIFWNVCSMIYIVNALALVSVEMLREKFLSLTDSSLDGDW